MPPLPACRSPAMAALADELRFGARRALLRQIEAAEALAPRVSADQTYPSDWISFQITGYRPDGEPALLSGDEVLADLSALVERLCAHADLTPEDLEGPFVAAGALAERWSVSRKTLDRLRRRGLIARRIVVSEGRGRTRLVFTEAAVEAFRAHDPQQIARPSGFTRMGAQTESVLIRRARRYRARLGWSRLQVAKRLAARFGRSAEGVRSLLERHDEKSSDPIFPPTNRSSGRERALAARLARRGMEPGEIAGALGRGGSDPRRVNRLVLQHRAAALRQIARGLPAGPETAVDFAAVAQHVESLLEGIELGRGVEAEDLLGQVRAARGARPGDADRERRLGAALGLVRTHAAGRVAALRSAETRGVDEAETLLRWAGLLRVALVRDQLGVVALAVEAAAGPLDEMTGQDAARLFGDGLRAAGHEADRFADRLVDGGAHARGGRLAGAVTVAATKSVTSGLRERDESSKAQRRLSPGIEPVDFTRDRPGAAWHAWVTVEAALGGGWRGRLAGSSSGGPFDGPDERDRRVLSLRFGLDGERPRTRGELAAVLGLPEMHAARAERREVRKIWLEGNDDG